mgnify:FL=1
MLDYYGSIIINEDEIIKRIIDSYQEKYDKDALKRIIKEFMDEGVIEKECSVSGWMVFFGKDSIKIVEEKYLSDLQDAKKRLEFSKILNERLSPDKIGNQDPYIVEQILQ